MPQIDYRKSANGVQGVNVVPLTWLYPRRFYDGSPGRGVVACPDCGAPADEMFGNHGGDCRPG